MFSRFSPYGGFIRSFKLTSFWKKLSSDEQLQIKEAYAKSLYPETMDMNIIDGKDMTAQPDTSVFSFLYGAAVKLVQQKEFSLAEKTLEMACKKVKEPAALHLIYNLLIDVYYKQRNENTNAVKKCISICRKDIKLAPSVAKDKQEIPSFKRLAIILESQGDYKGAIEVSQMALKHGLNDGTKGGYEGRIEKLQTKVQQ